MFLRSRCKSKDRKLRLGLLGGGHVSAAASGAGVASEQLAAGQKHAWPSNFRLLKKMCCFLLKGIIGNQFHY